MNHILNPDNPVMAFITRITYSVYLNLLWFICYLPVVTIGASTTALFYVTLKMAKNEEGNITAAFFRSFRENFRQASVIAARLLQHGLYYSKDLEKGKNM